MYEKPIWTVEDPLAYVFLLGGLTALSKRDSLLFQCCVVLGVLTRETLLLLVVVRWLYIKESLTKKLLVSVPGLLSLIIVRVALGGDIMYDPLAAGSRFNFQHPVEACVYVFATFGVLWLVAPFAWREDTELRDTPLNGRICLLVVLLIFLTSLYGGRLRETRLLFLAFPWIVVPSAVYIVTLLKQLADTRVLLKMFVVILCASVAWKVSSMFLVSLFPSIGEVVDSLPWEMSVHLAMSCLFTLIFILWLIVGRPIKHVLGR